MKRFLSLLIIAVMVLTLVPTAGASEVEQMVINATKTDRAYIEKDISGLLANGGTLLLEYDFTADDDEILGACFVQKKEYSKYFPVYYNAETNKLWYESNGISGTGLGSVTEGAAVDGARYHIVSLLNIKASGSTITTYVNGELVRNAVNCRITTQEATYPWQYLRAYGGSYARLSVLESSSFDYASYSVDVTAEEEHSSFISLSKEKRADYLLTIKNKTYTADELKEALGVPFGAELTLMRGRYELTGTDTVTDGTLLYVKSANELQTVIYRIKTDSSVVSSSVYSVDNEKCTISGVSADTNGEALIGNLTIASGYEALGVYCQGEQIAGNITDGMVLKISRNGEILEYTLSCDENSAEIKSENYIIDGTGKKIYGVLKYAPCDKFVENITVTDGTEIVGIYDGEDVCTGEINKDGLTLKTKKGEDITKWEIKLLDFDGKLKVSESNTTLGGLYNKLTDKTILVSGDLIASNNASVSFYDLYSEDGKIVSCESDGYIYFLNRRSEVRWTEDKTFNFNVIINTLTGEAKAYIDGELVLDNINAFWFDILKNPISLKANFSTDNLEILPVFSVDVLSLDEEAKTDNFGLVSEYYEIIDSVINMTGAEITVQAFLDRISATNGASAYVCTSDGRILDSDDTIGDEMYVLAGRGTSEKRYELQILTDAIASIGRVSFYKNEKLAENNIGNAFTIPIIEKDAQNITPMLALDDDLVVSLRVSNYFSTPKKVNVFAAGYDENGNLCAVSAITDITIDGLTDGQAVSGKIPAEKLSNAHFIKIYLWADELTPVCESEIYVSNDTSFLDEKIDDEVQAPLYRDEAPNIISSALVCPNYKGLIFAENGENDIQFMIRVDKEKLTERGKTLSDFKAEITICDQSQAEVLKSETEEISTEMSIAFSSKYLELGDYKLKASLIDKTTLEETDYNVWTLRKRKGDISELDTYIDENGRYIKNGKPKFYIGMFGDIFTNLEQIDKLKGNGIDGIYLYQNAQLAELTTDWEAWLDKIYESGMDFFANAGVFHGTGDYNINFRLTKPSDEGPVIEKIVRALKNSPAVSGYYVGDEQNVETTDRFRWHQEIISAYDLGKPTVYVDFRNNRNTVFSHNASADIMGLDNYPVRYTENDANISSISSYTKVMSENFINKPVWMVLQSGNRGLWWDDDGKINAENPSQTPTEKQMRNMAMQAVINGAEGIWWYSYAALMNEALDGRNVGEDILNRIERIKDLDELLSRPIGVSRLFSSWGDIIMSDEETPLVDFVGNNNIEFTTRRYEGKTYIFVANKSIHNEKAMFKIDGATSVKDIFTGEIYNVNPDGSFTANIENIGIAVFEIEHGEFLSNDSDASAISFYNDKESYVVLENDDGELVVNVPEDADEICYHFEISEKASLYFNGTYANTKGTINTNGTFKVVAEDGSYTEYKVLINGIK